MEGKKEGREGRREGRREEEHFIAIPKYLSEAG
jgi:hypothetical protein